MLLLTNVADIQYNMTDICSSVCSCDCVVYRKGIFYGSVYINLLLLS